MRRPNLPRSLTGVLLLGLALGGAGCLFDKAGLARPGDGGLDAGGDGFVDPDGGGAPAAPIRVTVPEVPGISPLAIVNETTAATALVEVEVGPASRSDQLVHLRVSGDPGGEVQAAPMAAPDGAGRVAFVVDLTVLPDGPLGLFAQVAAAAGPTSAETSGAATKDTQVTLLVDPVATPTDDASQVVSGITEPGAEVTVRNALNGALALGPAGAADGYFELLVDLETAGVNAVTVAARDLAWNRLVVDVDRFGLTLDIVRQSPAPVPFTDESASRLPAQPGPACGDGGGATFAYIGPHDLAAGETAPDLFVSCLNTVLLNNGQGVFSASAAFGVTFVGTRGASWGDFDNDGDQDLVLTSWIGGVTEMHVYRNLLVPSGTLDFEEATDVFLFDPGNPEGVAWIDYDADGHLDLVLQDGNTNRMFRNPGAGQPFTDETASSGINTLIDFLNNGHWLAVADYDADGDVDVVLHDETGLGFLMENLGGTFADSTAARGLSFGGWPKVGLGWGDMDNDGDFDLFIPRVASFGTANHLYRYDAGSDSFNDVAALGGVDAPVPDDGFAWGDIDNDGRIDLVFYAWQSGSTWGLFQRFNRGDSNGDGVPEFELWQTNFTPASPGSFAPEGLLLSDVDADGDLDCFIASRGGGHLLLISALNEPPTGVNPARDPRYLKVVLQGNGVSTSRTALGSVVLVRECDTGNLVGTREVNGAKGNGGQSSPVLFFGGVRPSRCYRVEARFLGGAAITTEVRPIELPGQTLVLLQP